MAVYYDRHAWARRFAPPHIHLSNLGPHPIGSITPAVRGHLVERMGVPIIIYDGFGKYAVLAPANTSLNILCAGCFTPGCVLDSDKCCRKVSSHCQHLTAQRQAKNPCVTLTTEDGLSAIHEQNERDGVTCRDFLPPDDYNPDGAVDCAGLKGVETVDLILELGRRDGGFEEVLNRVDTDAIVERAKSAGVKFLLDAREDDLRHELRRITDGGGPSIEAYYNGPKVPGIPHHTDHLGATGSESGLAKRAKPAKRAKAGVVDSDFLPPDRNPIPVKDLKGKSPCKKAYTTRSKVKRGHNKTRSKKTEAKTKVH